jgi:hypothetical protein
VCEDLSKTRWDTSTDNLKYDENNVEYVPERVQQEHKMNTMNATLEKFGLTALVTLVAVMFVTMFAGYMTVGLVAVAAFSALSAIMVVQQMMEA